MAPPVMAHEGKPTLCVINYNGATFLHTTLTAACALQDRFEVILVVDNGSQDNSVELIEQSFPTVQIKRLPVNLGAGGARNVGLREAPTDLILFIDNDVALTEACVDHLLAAVAEHPAAALAAAGIVYAHRRDTMQYDGAQCHLLGMQTLLDEDIPIDSVESRVRKVGSLSTCAFLAVRSRLPPGEYFDEVFFYMFEDHDFGVRVRMLGAEVLSVPAAICYHGAGTLGLSIRQIGTYSSKRVYYLIRNRWLFLLKNFSTRTLLVMAPLFVFYEAAQLVITIKKGWMREWWQSVRWIAGNLPKIRAERRRIQRSKTVPDRQVLIGGRIPFRRELTTGKVERAALALLDAVVVSYGKIAAKLI